MGIRAERILVVDAKFKSGASLTVSDATLRGQYGKNCDIRYALILVYGGLDQSRWQVVKSYQPWLFQIPNLKKSTAYVAYYTNIDPSQEIDPIREELRP